jgi:hypothetical protein
MSNSSASINGIFSLLSEEPELRARFRTEMLKQEQTKAWNKKDKRRRLKTEAQEDDAIRKVILDADELIHADKLIQTGRAEATSATSRRADEMPAEDDATRKIILDADELIHADKLIQTGSAEKARTRDELEARTFRGDTVSRVGRAVSEMLEARTSRGDTVSRVGRELSEMQQERQVNEAAEEEANAAEEAFYHKAITDGIIYRKKYGLPKQLGDVDVWPKQPDDKIPHMFIGVIVICCLFIVLLLMMIITHYVTGGSKVYRDTVNECLESKKNKCEFAVVEEWKKNKINEFEAWFQLYRQYVTLPVKLVLVVLLLVMVIFIMKDRLNKTSRRRRTEWIALFVIASVASIESLSQIAIPPFVDYKFKNELANDLANDLANNLANCSNRLDLCKDEIKDAQAQLDKWNQTNIYHAILTILLVTIIVVAVYWYDNKLYRGN